MDTSEIYSKHKQTKKGTSVEVTLKQHSIVQQQAKHVEVVFQCSFSPIHIVSGISFAKIIFQFSLPLALVSASMMHMENLLYFLDSGYNLLFMFLVSRNLRLIFKQQKRVWSLYK
jgi:hypothetical protein